MKIFLTEYDAGFPIGSFLSSGFSVEEIVSGLSMANQRIAEKLKIHRDTLQLVDGKIRAIGIAGIVQLTKEIELEIAPKFITAVNDDSWKETLYLLSTMSKYGDILTTEKIHADTSYKSSLYDIASRILAYEYLLYKRKPIRQYRKNQFRDFSIEGDIDFSTVFERHPDGVRQSAVRFDRLNAYNATISKAMQIVRPYASNPQTQNILSAAILEFGAQGAPSKKKLNVPARNREWKQAYDLSYDIILGLGTAYDAGRLLSPGFVVDTWQLWEWLITAGMRTDNIAYKAIPQSQNLWGIKESAGKQYNVNVFPDVEMRMTDGSETPVFLVDAKYKILKNMGTGEIERADLYEGFAFCKATRTRKLVLVYPENESPSNIPGTVRLYSSYFLGDIVIYAVLVSFGSIKKKGGVYTFAQNLQAGIKDIIEDVSS